MPHNYSADYIDPDDYLTLVGSVARRTYLKPSSVFDHDDAVGAGAESLWKAITSYESGHGLSLTTYAYRRIRWGILSEYRRQFPYAPGRYDPERDKLVEVLHFGMETAGGDDDIFLEETIPDTSASDHDSCLDIRDAIKRLTLREQAVVHGVYWDGKSCTEVSGDLGVSISCASHCLKIAIGKLRTILDGGTLRPPGRPSQQSSYSTPLVDSLTSEVARV